MSFSYPPVYPRGFRYGIDQDNVVKKGPVHGALQFLPKAAAPGYGRVRSVQWVAPSTVDPAPQPVRLGSRYHMLPRLRNRLRHESMVSGEVRGPQC